MRAKRWVKRAQSECQVRQWKDLKSHLLNAQDPSSKILTMTTVELPANKKLSSIRHTRTHEWIYVVKGSALAILDNKRITLKPGDYLYLPPRVWHSFRSRSEGLLALSLYLPGFNWQKPDVQIQQALR